MSQQLDSITACNKHNPLLGPFQYGGNASLSTVNLTNRNIASGKYLSSLVIWSCQKFIGQGKASLRIVTLYMPLPPDQMAGPDSVYSQHLTNFNNTNSRICPRKFFFNDLKKEVKSGKTGRLNSLHGRLQWLYSQPQIPPIFIKARTQITHYGQTRIWRSGFHQI